MYGFINECEPNFSSEFGGEGGASTYSGLRIGKYAENNSVLLKVLKTLCLALILSSYLIKSINVVSLGENSVWKCLNLIDTGSDGGLVTFSVSFRKRVTLWGPLTCPGQVPMLLMPKSGPGSY